MIIPNFLITMGDPAGIGPEIILKSFLNEKISALDCLVVGSFKVLEYTLNCLKLPFSLVHYQEKVYAPSSNSICIWNIDNVNITQYQPGKISADYGQAAYQYLKIAIELALSRKNRKDTAIITAPIQKNALKLAGIEEAGHTEILQRLTDVSDVMTMFVVDKLRVFFYTRHLSLQEAIMALNIDKIVCYLEQMTTYLKQIGIPQPRLALAALNPHASDNGLFGNEESKILEPAIKIAQNKGLFIDGPVPADSVFYQGLQGKYDAILSLYHDQGHIACKTYNFERTISMTLGLPFLRTSVDHGTAFDIAGKWIANSISMEEAILQAKKNIFLKK